MREDVGLAVASKTQRLVESLQAMANSNGLSPEAGQQLRQVLEQHAAVQQAAAEQASELRELGSLLDLAHMIVRGVDDRISRWTAGAERLYGFTAEQALGQLYPELLKTQFPEPLEQIREALLAQGQWEGALVHRRGDGQQVAVACRWVLRRDEQGAPISIVELSQEIPAAGAHKRSFEAEQAFVRQIIDADPNLIFVKNGQGQFVAVNQAMAALYETSPARLVDRLNRDVLPNPKDYERYGRVDRQVLRTGQAVTVEEIHECAGGRKIWFLTTKKPIRLPDGELGVLGVSQDITERKRAEEILRSSEQHLQWLLESIPHMVWTATPGGELDHVNRRCLHYLGMAESDVLGQGWVSAVHPEDREGMMSRWRTSLQEGSEYQAEFRLRHRSGEYRWHRMHALPMRNAEGRIVCWCGTATDIHEQKQIEDERQRLLDRLHLQIEQMPIGCVTNDRAFRIIGWNPAAERIFGFKAEEAIGKDPYDLYVPKSAWAVVEERRRRLERGDMEAHGINENLTKDGRTILCHWTNTPLFDERGQYLGRMGMVQDVTEQVRAQEALKQAKEAAEAANVAKDRFLAMLSHELRTPLTPVVMLASSLERDASLPQAVRDDMSTIRRNVEIQARIVDDLLDLSRFTSGKLNIQMRPLDVHEQLRMVEGIWRSSITYKGLVVQWDLQAKQHHVSGDEARLQQVFWNLIGNAIKFTPEGGTITLCSSNDADGKVLVEVRDTGLGIKPEMLERIFSAFEQGEEGQAKGGLGLGLAISKAIVELHGGAITASSEGPGRGARFCVQLPTMTWSAAAAEAPAVPQLAPLRILLVEDHEDTGRILARLLRAQGHAVEHVTCGKAALDLAAGMVFDLLISDLGLPDISGLDLMQQLARRYQVKGIAVSGYGTEADVHQSNKAGFAAHITKPVDLKELEKAMQYVIRGPQAQ